MKIDWKKIAPYVVALVVFIGFAIAYCSPIMDGKVLVQGDVNNWKGAAQEALEYNAQHDECTWWTNSMFGGMPTFQISGKVESGYISGWWKRIMQNTLGEPRAAISLYFIGFFLMLLCFGVNPWLSIVGALAIGMSSYFFLIIPAGHMSKAFAIGALAPIIGGVYAVFRKRYALGIPMVLIFLPYGMLLHPQMTYYVGLLIGVMVLTEIIWACVQKDWKGIGIALAILIACLGLSYGARYTSMKMNQDYLKQTMRGGHSELTQEAKDKPAEGLDLKYATDWSYGKAETMTLLIPGWEGGASGYDVGKDSQLCQTMRKKGVPRRDAEAFCKHAPTYRGEKMFTSGAVYAGAVVCFLFLLGMIIVPGPYKWALLFATLMSVFLAWGRNMMWFTEFFFNYFPMYNKFRAVESILVVAEITMPLLGFLGLQRIIEGKMDWKELRPCICIAAGLTALFCLVPALFAGSFDVTSSYDAQWKNQVPAWLYDAILDERVAMIKADAWRSLLFVVLGFGLTFWYAWQRNKSGFQTKHAALFIGGLLVLVLADMIPVNKRFFNNDQFVKQKDSEAFFKMQPWEEQILQDKSLDYRVLNLDANTFNDARTSYRLKSIGGYSAVKLRRYQDLIDAHISKMNWNVLNMLNTKYIVSRNTVYPNPEAMGNVWFVNDVQFVPTPDDESAALNSLDLRKTAVADEQFRSALSCTGTPAEGDNILLTQYQPNELIYSSHATNDRIAVFSEIYYPDGWHLTVDGEEVAIGRVNYVLRAAVIPAGDHTLRMYFKPSILQWEWLCITLAILTLVISAGCAVWGLWKKFRS
jgi:hypothetical protein